MHNSVVRQQERMNLMRFLGLAAFLVAVAIGSLALPTDAAGGGAPVYFAPATRVMLFSTGARQWVLAKFSETKPGDEFYSNAQVYRVVDSKHATSVLSAGTDKIFEADQAYDKASSRKPASWDVVQVLSKDMLPTGHALLSTVQPGSTIRFLGKAYSIAADSSLRDTGLVFSADARSLQRIQITTSSWQHILDGHAAGGKTNPGKSTFNRVQEIQALIKNAEIVVPVQEPNGYFKREFDAGRPIGYDGLTSRQTSTIRVITTQSGNLVTAYPIVK